MTTEVAATDVATRVLGRLERIRTLDRMDAPAGVLLDELRELVLEAEAWARAEGDRRAREAVEELGARVSGAVERQSASDECLGLAGTAIGGVPQERERS